MPPLTGVPTDDRRDRPDQGRPVPFLPSGPELLFGVGVVRRYDDEFRGSMRTGPWNAGPDGAGCVGTLGVLVDDVLGSSVLVTRPAGSWSVSTEITIDVVADLPTDGTVLTCTGRAVRRGASGGLARGEVLDEDGRCIAIATQRQRFIPGGDPSATPAVPGTVTAPPPAPDTLAAIGGVLHRHDGGVELVVAGSGGLANPAGNVHGGISLCASELLGAVVLDAAAAPLVTASVHIVYLRPMPLTAPTTYTAEVVHHGRTLGVARVSARSAAGKVCTVATVTRHAAHL